MRKASNSYKNSMNALMRDRAYISISVGVVSQEAQASAIASGDFTEFTDLSKVFKMREAFNEYASYEQNYWRADGTQLLKPRDNNFVNTDITTPFESKKVKISFDNAYNIRGLTVTFGKSSYPTRLKIKTSLDEEFEYTNDTDLFQTDEVFGEISWLEIEAVEMIGGTQRLHIHQILCGIGLVFDNETVENASREDNVSSISAELPSKSFSVTVFDTENVFNVEDSNSFINFLEQRQLVSCSIGMTLEDKTIEWINLGYTYLKDWKSSKGKMQFSCSDLIEQMNDEYTLGNKIYQRSAYEEAESILQDMGLEPDEYEIDTYLYDVTLVNPMPVGRHSECLQLLANACRSTLYQSDDRKIIIRSNFSNVLNPEQITVESSNTTDWGTLENIFEGSTVNYVELLRDYYKTNDTMYLLPDDNQYLEGTGFVSAEISDEFGYFENNPYLFFDFGELFVFRTIYCLFGMAIPTEIKITTFNNKAIVDEFIYVDEQIKQENMFINSFKPFDSCKVEFVKAQPKQRITISRFSFGDLTDYRLTRQNMLENPIGYQEERTKSVSVKVFSFENDEKGEAKQIDDDVWVTSFVHPVGVNQKVENPLIHTEEHAQQVSRWIAEYYSSNIFYDINYRGEPRIEALDIIRMDSEAISNLQVSVDKVNLSFNGAFKGSLSLHKVKSNI